MGKEKKEKIKTQVRTKLHGEELETAVQEHIKTFRKREELDQERREEAKESKDRLKKLDVEIKAQRETLDYGAFVECEVMVTTHANGRKTYERLDTNERIEEEQLPPQFELDLGETGVDPPETTESDDLD